MDICYTFVQTHKMLNTKSKCQGKLWTLGDYHYIIGSFMVKQMNKHTNITILVSDADNVWAQEYKKNFCNFLLIFL